METEILSRSETAQRKESYIVQGYGPSYWKPISLRPTFLLSVFSISILLIAILQVLLLQSQRNNGILFAPSINDLPLSKSFAFLYLPTIIAVIYGFLWTWIDLDVRRIEPYVQLARGEGASGEVSLLLSYPADFLASVPLKAFRHRHWNPFVASLATVFVFWGLTPSQAGIFANSVVVQTVSLQIAHSTSILSLSEQGDTLSAKSANSVSSILWLNETLQPYMTRDAVVAPFGPILNSGSDQKGNWTAETIQFFANVSCEQATVWQRNDIYYLNSTWGCMYSAPPARSAVSDNNTDDSKIFDTLYVGYFNIDGLADFYLSNGGCPKDETHSFLVQWSKALVPGSIFAKMTGSEQRLNANITTMFCRSAYYSQRVLATVRLPEKSLVVVQALGAPAPLPADVFNSTSFEAGMSEGRDRFRTNFPSLEWPDQTSYLQDSALYLGYLPKMAPFAIGAKQLPFAEYLNPDVLAESYQNAYRLLFARQFSDALLPILDQSTAASGQLTSQTEAVILVPAFTYIVEALLGIAACFAASILYFSTRSRSKLHSDPATISATMSLVANDKPLLDALGGFDDANVKQLRTAFKSKTFRFGGTTKKNSGLEYQLKLGTGDDIAEEHHSASSLYSSQQLVRRSSEEALPGVYPTELSLKVGLSFLCALGILVASIAILYIVISTGDGLPLPTSNRFVRQLLENYIPTGVATLIEPFWTLLNRNLCFLQPFEALRQGQKRAGRSIGLDYTSLPPQLVIGKAILGRDFLLATVCAMTLLANVLSVSFSGLLFEAIVSLPVNSVFEQPYTSTFQRLNGSASAFAQSTGDTIEPFYIATSNQTANTPLPPWTDKHFFYQPFNVRVGDNQTSTRTAYTNAIGATLDCQALSAASTFSVTGTQANGFGSANIPSTLNLTVVVQKNDAQVFCIPRAAQEGRNHTLDAPFFVNGRPTGNCAFEFVFPLQGAAGSSVDDSLYCQKHIAAGWIHGKLVNGTLLPDEVPSTTIPSIVESYTSSIMVCQSRIMAGLAKVTVAGDGHVIDSRDLQASEANSSMFTSTASDVLGQAHQFILTQGLTWHNDSFPSDFGNYILGEATNSSSLVSPNAPLPKLEDISGPFTDLYSKLFAIWMAENKDQLLDRAADATVEGVMLHPTTRIFMSTTMFILAESILGMYMIVTVILYIRRPWKILCRPPTDLASIIAFFAASRAVKDLEDTASMTTQRRAEYLEELDERYGFGNFIGRDGKAHVGIEKYPYVAALTRSGTFSTASESTGGVVNNLRALNGRVRKWKSGKALEGGWM